MTNLTATGGVSGPGRIGRVAIGDLLKRAAARFPDRIALTDGARRVSFTEIERDANRFANYLVQRGLKPGDKISTICNNSVEFVKALFGIHRAGLVWVPINTMLGPADMDYILDHAEVRFAIIDDMLHAQIAPFVVPEGNELTYECGFTLCGKHRHTPVGELDIEAACGSRRRGAAHRPVLDVAHQGEATGEDALVGIGFQQRF